VTIIPYAAKTYYAATKGPYEFVWTVPGQHVSTIPGQHVSTIPGQHVSTIPAQHVSTIPGQYVSTIPAPQNSSAIFVNTVLKGRFRDANEVFEVSKFWEIRSQSGLLSDPYIIGHPSTPEITTRSLLAVPVYTLRAATPLRRPYRRFRGVRPQGGRPVAVLLPPWIPHAVLPWSTAARNLFWLLICR
jgi:hypothetical protein